jgi:chromosome segregation ATPase
MQLPDFINRALAFFQKAEANLTAEQELAQAKAKVVSLDAEIVTLKEKLTGAESQAKELTAKLEPQAVRITQLEADIEKEKSKATETLAGLGVKPENIPAPAAGTQATESEPGKELVDKFLAIKDPGEKTLFFRKNEKAIHAAAAARRS